jgi:pyridoxal phosphate enzyme (YggS family)
MTPDLNQAPEAPHDIAGALHRIRAAIAAAAIGADRDPAAVALVAVSKFHPAEAVAAAMAASQTIFGENRVQEAAAKFTPLRASSPSFTLHIIGPLQTNKARDAVRIADMIETLDRPRLADALATAAEQEGRMPSLLVQVNVGDEPQKGGVSRAEADGFIAAMQRRFEDRLRGLMCIPPADGDPTPHFLWLRDCAARHGLGQLSMGMSGDFAAAIACGATHVRIGTAIFGHRPAGASGAATSTL